MGVSDFTLKKIQQAYAGGPLSRFGSQFALDALSWATAFALAVALRLEFEADAQTWVSLIGLSAVAAVLQLLLGWAFFLYRGRHPYGSFDEVRALLWVLLSVTAILGSLVFAVGLQAHLPRLTPLIAAPFAFVLMGGARYVKRLLLERAMRPGEDAERALVYGAGYLGANMIRRMRTDKGTRFLPVGMVDDDRLKRNVWHHGVRVLGMGDNLVNIARQTKADVLVVTIARADAALLTRVADAAREADIRVLVLPPLDEVLAGRTKVNDLRDLSIEDLIGRHPVDTEVESIAGYLQGVRVLVTGAGGSIGSELCRQISRFSPAELIMVDHDETGLQSTQISILGHGLLDTKDVVLASIRDEDALKLIFAQRRPQVVFHAAALKHLPMLEQYPHEAWQTNVLGTLNVLRAAQSVGVLTFVNISTDKAANPTSVLGHSKRVAEKLTAWAARHTGARYLSVRFGNVIGSRGSMLPTFTALIEAGGPLTVTHPEVTRFFMTISEACQLVVQAGAIGNPGEVLILDMGQPVKILDIARRMIEMSGKQIEIVFTGLRPGEKLHEELIGARESDARPVHPKISHAWVDDLAPENLDFDHWLRRCQEESTEVTQILDVTANGGQPDD